MTDARIPDHCGWAARGYWRQAYDAAVSDLRRVTAERDKWFEGAGAHHVASMQQSQRADRAEVALAAVEQRIKLLCDNDEWNLGLHEALDLVKAEREAGKTQIEGLSADNERVRQANYALVQSCEQHRTRAEAAEAEVARLTAQAREDAMQLLATSGQAQDALVEVATLRAELDAARGRVKPLVWTQLAITKEHKGLSGVWLCAWGINGQYEVHVFDTDPTHVMLNGPDIVPTAIYTTIEAAKAAAQADYTARILATLEPDPAVARMREPDSDWGDFIWSALNEAEKAMRKFPQPNYVISKIAEEAGEVVKAAIHCAEGRETTENVRGEMKQLVAMLYRLWVEGDQVHGMLAARTSGTGVGE